jgi:single-stranded DNA-binding protein
MNLAALIGEVASDVEGSGEEATFRLAVSRGGGEAQVLGVRAAGRQAEACRAYLRPGHRVAVEGRVAPREEAVEVLADRVQFLTTRAQAAVLAEARPEPSPDDATPRRGPGVPGPARAARGAGRRSGAAAGATR